MDLKIKSVETKKNNIKQREIMKNNIIPRHPSTSIFIGAIGSGKSTLIINLLQNENMYGPDKKTGKSYFDCIFVLTGSDDDLYDTLVKKNILDKDKIKLDPEPSDIQTIIDIQRRRIDHVGIDKAEKVLIIIDDMVNDNSFMKSQEMKALFVKPRQLSISVWLLSQYLMLIPRTCRVNSLHIFFFRGNRVDCNILCEQFCPSTMDKNKFMRLIDHATKDKEDETHNFLYINRRAKHENRFRRNIDKIIKF